MKHLIQKTCEFCGKQFEVMKCRKDKARFCSYSCRSRFTMGKGETARFWKGGKGSSVCIHCGKTFTNTNGNPNRYCSVKCLDEARMKRVETKCVNCGKATIKKLSKFNESNNHFCSQKCAKDYLVGEKSHLWRGGDGYYPETFNRKFKTIIRERDNFTCAICKEYGNEVHHVNYVKNDTIPENCVTLCKSCHCKTNHHREYWQSLLKRPE